MKAIIFNSPPGGGKTTAADYCHNAFNNTYRMDFKDKLIEQAICLSGMDLPEWWATYNNPVTPNKETPLMRLGGLSQRQFLIKISEEWMKPLFGQDYYGNIVVNGIKEMEKWDRKTVIIADGGMVREVQPVIDYLGKENVMLVRIFRAGCTFKNDSRNYLPLGMFEVGCDIFNNTSKEDFLDNVVKSVGWFINS